MNLLLFFMIFGSVLVSAQESCDRNKNDNLSSIGEALEIGSWPLLDNSEGQNNKWKSIGSLVVGRNHCTVTLIEPPGDCGMNPDQEAMVVTAGHCRDVSKDVFQGPVQEESSVSFNYFRDTKESQVKAPVKEYVYSTMSEKDVAIIRLGKTYRELAALGITPKKISRQPISGALYNPSIPVQNIEGETFLRGQNCQSKGKASIIEGSYLWPDSIKLDCLAKGGASGSGLFNESGEIAGLINTTNPMAGSPHKPCGMNAPCEVQDGEAVAPSSFPSTYGIDLSYLHQCFSFACTFEARNPGCDMPSETPPKVWVSSPTNDPVISFREAGAVAVKYKFGPPGTNCGDPEGYTEMENPPERIPLEMAGEGRKIFCALVKKEDGTWTDLAHGSHTTFTIDRTPPVTKVISMGEDRVRVTAEDPLDFDFGKFKFVDSLSDCQDRKGYTSIDPVSAQRGISLSMGGKPFVCFTSFDNVDNPGSIVTMETGISAAPAPAPVVEPVQKPMTSHQPEEANEGFSLFPQSE